MYLLLSNKLNLLISTKISFCNLSENLIKTFPNVGFKIPAISFRSVVLPEPFAPYKRIKSFCFMQSEMLFKIYSLCLLYL